MAKYTFSLTLIGEGSNETEAWNNAVESFAMDPGDCPGKIIDENSPDKPSVVSLRLRRKSETGEWVVVYYENSHKIESKCYYTTDKQDAELTMREMAIRLLRDGYCIHDPNPKQNIMDFVLN